MYAIALSHAILYRRIVLVQYHPAPSSECSLETMRGDRTTKKERVRERRRHHRGRDHPGWAWLLLVSVSPLPAVAVTRSVQLASRLPLDVGLSLVQLQLLHLLLHLLAPMARAAMRVAVPETIREGNCDCRCFSWHVKNRSAGSCWFFCLVRLLLVIVPDACDSRASI